MPAEGRLLWSEVAGRWGRGAAKFKGKVLVHLTPILTSGRNSSAMSSH